MGVENTPGTVQAALYLGNGVGSAISYSLCLLRQLSGPFDIFDWFYYMEKIQDFDHASLIVYSINDSSSYTSQFF